MNAESNTGARGSGRIAVALLFLMFVVFFHRALIIGEAFFFRDHYQEYYPLKRLALQIASAGSIPAWNPASMMGQPFLANPNWTLLYPPNIILVAGDFTRMYTLLVAFHFLAAVLGFYYLCRIRGASAVASSTAAIMFGFGGFIVSLGSFMPTLFTIAWLPWVLGTLVEYARSGESRRIWPLIAFTSLMILAGEPVTVLSTIVIGLVLLATEPGPILAHIRRMTLNPRLAVLLLLAVAVWPRISFLAASGRAPGLPLEMAAAWPLDLTTLPSLIVPNIFGDVHEYWPWRAFGAFLTHNRFPYLMSIYAGIPLLLLASARLARRPFPKLQMTLVVVTLLLSFGTHTPLFELMWRYVPLAGSIRYPIKFLFFTLFFAALWAAEGFDQIRTTKRIPRTVITVFTTIALTLAILWFHYSPSTIREILQQRPSAEAAQAISTHLHTSILRSVSILVAAGLSIWLLSRSRVFALLALIVADLYTANARLNPTATAELYKPQPIATRISSEGGRLMVLAPFAGRGDTQPAAFKTYSHYLNYGGRASLYALSAADSGVLLAFDPSIDRTFSQRTQRLIDGLRGKRFAEAKQVFDATNVRWFLSPEPLNAPGLVLQSYVPVPEPARLMLYENTSAMPRYYVFTGAVESVAEAEQAARMHDDSFDPRRDLLVDGPLRMKHEGEAQWSECEPVSIEPNRLVLRASASAPGFLVCSDTWDAGWTADVEGEAVSIHVAQAAFRAIEIPAGSHLVTMQYGTGMHVASVLAAGLLTLIVTLGCIIRF